MKRGWVTYVGVLIFAVWLGVTLLLRFEPKDVITTWADVTQTRVETEATHSGPVFLYVTDVAPPDTRTLRVESRFAPVIKDDRTCVEISTGSISGQVQVVITDPKLCLGL